MLGDIKHVVHSICRHLYQLTTDSCHACPDNAELLKRALALPRLQQNSLLGQELLIALSNNLVKSVIRTPKCMAMNDRVTITEMAVGQNRVVDHRK